MLYIIRFVIFIEWWYFDILSFKNDLFIISKVLFSWRTEELKWWEESIEESSYRNNPTESHYIQYLRDHFQIDEFFLKEDEMLLNRYDDNVDYRNSLKNNPSHYLINERYNAKKKKETKRQSCDTESDNAIFTNKRI